MRRMLLSEEALEEMGLKYTTGEFDGTGSGDVAINHGLGEVPFLFACQVFLKAGDRNVTA